MGNFPLLSSLQRVSTRCLFQNVQLIYYSQRINVTSQYNDGGSSRYSKWPNDWMVPLVKQALLSPCTRKKRLQIKMTNDYNWIGVQENIGMFIKS